MFFCKKSSFLIHFEFLNNRHKCMKVVDAKGRFVDLLPWVICLGFSYPNFIVSNFKIKVKFSCILVIHNDHMVELVDLINMSTYWLG
jgi:hypothetical protein